LKAIAGTQSSEEVLAASYLDRGELGELMLYLSLRLELKATQPVPSSEGLSDKPLLSSSSSELENRTLFSEIAHVFFIDAKSESMSLRKRNAELEHAITFSIAHRVSTGLSIAVIIYEHNG
jgi:hypothetical protein